MFNQIRIFAVAWLVLAGLSLFGQSTDFRRKVGVGFHGGYTISEVNFRPGLLDPSINYKAISTFNYGLVLNFIGEPFAGIQIEVNVSQRGWIEEADSAYTYTRKMNYIEVPVLTHLSFGKKRMRYIFNLGPYVAFHQSFSETYEMFDDQAQIPESDSIDYYYGRVVDSPTDFGFIFDGGVGVHTKYGTFQVKARYTQAVTNLFKQYPEGQFRFSQTRNIYIGFAYYYNFYFRPK
ncbi:MAG TPA: hypothetical protein DDX98_11070 [Bacteroidales bacterium]|jgi:hypothetical protein|nr:hypothetical protein [Bacteroidales bacterium]